MPRLLVADEAAHEFLGLFVGDAAQQRHRLQQVRFAHVGFADNQVHAARVQRDILDGLKILDAQELDGVFHGATGI